jgi:hypothetical protein
VNIYGGEIISAYSSGHPYDSALQPPDKFYEFRYYSRISGSRTGDYEEFYLLG